MFIMGQGFSKRLYILLLTLCLMASSPWAMARPKWGQVGGLTFLTEILVPGAGNTSSRLRSRDAAEQARTKARESVAESMPAPANVANDTILTEEEGFLVPGRSSAPPDNRIRAKEYLQNDADVNKVIITSQPVMEPDGDAKTTRDNLNRNLAKARRYSQDQQDEPGSTGKFFEFGTTTGVMGKDGVIVMACNGVNNNAGRIGDDTQSGSVFTVMVKGKPYQARCK